MVGMKLLILKVLFHIEEKMIDYLDYLYMQKVKRQSTRRLSLEEVKRELAIE